MRHRPNNLNLLVRRHALAALVSLPAAATAQAPGAAVLRPPTPRQSLGPFYPRTPEERPRETDADLVVVQAERVLSRGVPLYLTGRVLDRSGTPVPAARIEIWQCDANAVYHHPAGGAEAERDPNFQGYGQTLTESDGAFHFRTIRPVAYPGRTPHIHVRVEARGRATLATQLYLAGEAGNARDFLFRQLSVEERAQLTLAMRPTESAHPLAQATAVSAAVDLVLA
ncbi:MAG: protocatechuate 3,4-dioxygenase [Burkholderiaceae bacterium]|jgi:protocatechuate 3,4-dioxygenase beta subunit|nr:protocatechuate 3,4-dioxygenase [Burkholderiaceae bacterium]